MKLSNVTMALLLFISSMVFNIVRADPLTQQRLAYREAVQLIKGDDDAKVREKLKLLHNYPLYPRLMQLWLQQHLYYTREIAAFLALHPKSRYAQRLHQQWFDYLSTHQQWQLIIDNYQKTPDLSQQCHFHWANYNLQNKVAALQWLQKNWPSQAALPIQCAQLSNKFLNSELLTAATVWQKFELVMLNEQPNLAKKLIPYFNAKDRVTAQFWLQIYRQPARVKQHTSWSAAPQNGWIFAHAIEKFAKKNLSKAVKLWDSDKQGFTLDHHRRQRVEKKLAIALVKKGDTSAYQRLNQLVFADQEVREWRVKAALLEHNWRHVFAAVERLNSLEKRKTKWQYWRARAYWQLGEKKAARRLFSQLATQRSYYGFIAADYVGREYQLQEQLFTQDFSKLARFTEQQDFQAVNELVYFKHPQESLEQWMYAIKKLSPWKLPVAINYALKQGWKKHALMTIKYADFLNDISQYFPVYHSASVFAVAASRKIDPAVIFAIIRQESAFNKDAVSPVGARGLMQIMPKTGEFIAKKLREPWVSTQALFNPGTNLRYGAYYYRRMLQQFDNHFALAAAAYNAGPHRVNRWLPKSDALSADIWIEMIPFTETRKYVKAILTYALIYQHKLKSNGLSMQNFLKDISPR